jgi:hypothetical protein
MPAGFRASAAMFVVMLRTFLGASVAYVGAQAADSGCVRRFASHKTSGKPANRSAIDISGDALCHHFHILLFQAGRNAVTTSICTVIAGVDAVAVFSRHCGFHGS